MCPSDGCSSLPGSPTRGGVGELLSRVPRRCASAVRLDLQQVSAKNGREELSQAGQAQETRRAPGTPLALLVQSEMGPSALRVVRVRNSFGLPLTASHQHRSRAGTLSSRCPSHTTDALGMGICLNRSGSIEILLDTWLPTPRSVLLAHNAHNEKHAIPSACIAYPPSISSPTGPEQHRPRPKHPDIGPAPTQLECADEESPLDPATFISADSLELRSRRLT